MQDGKTEAAQYRRPRRDRHPHPCRRALRHAWDDGYDEFQAAMADYFKSPNKHPPTVPETAAYYRERKIAAVIFPGRRRARDRIPPLLDTRKWQDRGREFRRADPVRLDRSAQGQARARARRGGWSRISASAASSSTRPCRASIRTTAWPIRSTRRSRKTAPSRCSIPARPASAPACAAASACG